MPSFSRVAERILLLVGATCLPAVGLSLGACEDDLTSRQCYDWPAEPCGGSQTSSGSGSTGSAAGPGDACPSDEEAGLYFCGPDSFKNGTKEGSQCCYDVTLGSGRPLRVDGQIRVAEVRHGARSTPEEVGRWWLRDALAEHASMASFARAAVELMALGAPLELVEGCHQAALDEARHAKICLEEARRFGVDVALDKLEVGASLALATDLESLVVSTFQEGCVGECVASALLFERAAATTDERLRAQILSMAEDEGRHAELAWRVVMWAVRTGGEPIARLVRDLADHIGTVAADDPFLTPTARVATSSAVVDRLVRPAAAACAMS